jgi:hypothetical protein
MMTAAGAASPCRSRDLGLGAEIDLARRMSAEAGEEGRDGKADGGTIVQKAAVSGGSGQRRRRR